MTLDEFFDYKGKIVIHCPTFQQALELLSKFDTMGKLWRGRTRYIEDNNWGMYREKTCYTNDGGFSPIDFFECEGYTILSYNDIEFMSSCGSIVPDDLTKQFNELMSI